MKRIFYSLILITACWVSCKKDKPGTTVPVGPTKDGTVVDRIKDSVFLYTQETYLWYDAIPNYQTFQPRNITGTTDADALTAEVDKLSQYKINPTTGKPYEDDGYGDGAAKYSFIDDGSVSGELNGTNGDFGFSVFFPSSTDLRIKYVYQNSPAGNAGLKRGYKITKINGRTGLDASVSADLNFVINAIFGGGTSINLTIDKSDGTPPVDVLVNSANYTINPVLKYQVYTIGAKKVGYVVFNTFTSLANASPQLLTAFNAFAAAKITDMVVDLRYNGGGYVATAEYIDNLIVPTAKNNTPMYTYYYNDKLQADNHPLLSAIYNIAKGDFLPANNQVKFTKNGSLNITNVSFIVSGSTASASELTINNLLPHMNVQLIGATTYGKPVGFFAIDINKYQLYVPQFETKNSLSKGGYYSGMTPGSADYPGVKVKDDVAKDFGDSTEVLLKTALDYVRNGTFAVSGPKVQSLASTSSRSLSEQQTRDIAIKLDERKFKGMVGGKRLTHK
jgi:carboxyl-terminal processing protease